MVLKNFQTKSALKKHLMVNYQLKIKNFVANLLSNVVH